MKILYTTQVDFENEFKILTNRSNMDMSSVIPVVNEILLAVKNNGDNALMAQVAKFDKYFINKADELLISQDDMLYAYERLDNSLKESLNLAYERIKAFHEHTRPVSFSYTDEYGSTLGAKYTPLDRAGLYIPGGKAAYPSSLLMNAIPAMVAGVKDIIVCTPAVNGIVNELLLAAMYLCKIKKAYKLGGASAIGAMAYGTDTVPKVDAITGPGNIYVATAKKLVYGDVNIDMIAGPSEIGIIADKSANSYHLAADLLSQAEHDELASSFLITTSKELACEVSKYIDDILPTLSRKSIARSSIENKGAIIVVKDMLEAVDLMNALAVEHLEIVTENPQEIADSIRHAGAIFLGHHTPEAMGDYLAGPNHTLPTGGSARFYSPLSVENFMKKSSIISMSEEGFKILSKACISLAESEGLGAHALSVLSRLEKK